MNIMPSIKLPLLSRIVKYFFFLSIFSCHQPKFEPTTVILPPFTFESKTNSTTLYALHHRERPEISGSEAESEIEFSLLLISNSICDFFLVTFESILKFGEDRTFYVMWVSNGEKIENKFYERSNSLVDLLCHTKRSDLEIHLKLVVSMLDRSTSECHLSTDLNNIHDLTDTLKEWELPRTHVKNNRWLTPVPTCWQGLFSSPNRLTILDDAGCELLAEIPETPAPMHLWVDARQSLLQQSALASH